MIEYLIRFQLNVFAILLLGVLFAIIKLRRDIYRFSALLLDAIIGLTVLALIAEPLSFIFDGSLTPFGIAMNYVSNYALVLVAPVLIGMWASYIDYKIFGDRRRLARRIFYQQGSLFMLVLCLVNLFTPFLFSINADHTYHAGPYQWFGYLVVYSYYLFIIITAILNRKRIRNSTLYGIIAFFILPIFGSMLQMFDSNLFFAWTMLAMTIVVVYIFLETTTGIRDFLTKLYSRRTLENHISNLLESSLPFGVVMIDLDSFKRVNDVYGHRIGDQVLIRFADLLLATFKHEKMVARLGGDEFVLVFNRSHEDTDASVVKRITELKRRVADDPVFQQYEMPGFSWGLARSAEGETIDQLLAAADREMYLDKQAWSPPG